MTSTKSLSERALQRVAVLDVYHDIDEMQLLKELADALDATDADKDEAYRQRSHLVAALARIYPSGIRATDIEGWEPEWHGCVFIDLPSGQISYHYHESHAHLFAGLSPYAKEWDGHDKETVHTRLAALRPALDQQAAEIELLKEGRTLHDELADHLEHEIAAQSALLAQAAAALELAITYIEDAERHGDETLNPLRETLAALRKARP